MRVLIADDNSNSRQLLTDIVDSMGLEVVSAANGPEAVQQAQSAAPDLLILDVNMPGMSGFEVCAKLKSDPETSQIPILMLTALGDVENRVQGLKLGADDYLTKPFNPRELIERVKTRLRFKVETDELRNMQRVIRDTFERYVSASVVEQLLQDPTQVQLGGKLQEVTVMFIDLEGFTSMAERTDPERLLAILNQYHTMVVGMVREHGGTIDKFIGDGVMALYNTPLEQSDHALMAVRTALNIHERLAAFHEQFEPRYRLKYNFGIHTGMAVVGNVGAPDIMNFTAVGDTVNLAARLESTSANGQILISSATLDCLGDVVRTNPLGSLKMKGRAEEVTAYEVIGLNA
ncbi:MAG: response regulator [Chloroflexi bacterium]|nr:response regulator [Chloroflexota bacterium]